MEKIDTDYKQRNLKSLAKLFKPFNRDWAPLTYKMAKNPEISIYVWIYENGAKELNSRPKSTIYWN